MTKKTILCKLIISTDEPEITGTNLIAIETALNNMLPPGPYSGRKFHLRFHFKKEMPEERRNFAPNKQKN